MKWLVVLGLMFLLPTNLAWAADENPVQIKEAPAQMVLSIKTKTSMEKIAEDIGRLYERLFDHINQKAIVPAGPPMTLCYSPPGFELELAACVPVAKGAQGEGDMEIVELPGGLVASVIHYGSYEGIGKTYEKIYFWISENGYHPIMPTREIYLVGRDVESDPSKYKTEIQWPVSK